MNSWKLTKIEITYPSSNKNNKNNKNFNNDKIKYYALTSLYFNYKNFQLQFTFDETNGKSFSIVDFTDKKNPDIIEDSENNNLTKILSKRKFPEFYSNITYDTIQYQVYENDDDGNYDTKTNIDLIKSGDYGYPITYESQYSISDYEFTSNLDIKKQIENIILENILSNLKKYI